MFFYKSPRDGWILSTLRFWRASDASWEAIKATHQHLDAESDEKRETALRLELIEIARLNGASDPETLKDILLTRVQSSRVTRDD